MDRTPGAVVLKRVTFLIEAFLIGAILVVGFGMALWNAGTRLLQLMN